MKTTLVVINYHSAELARSAIASARAATEADLEVIVLDNSTSAEEVARLETLDLDRLIIAEANLGYGAGVNRVLGQCSGEAIIVSNPDVEFMPGSVNQLIAPLRDERVALTGPRFYWDADLEWHLPPPERMTFRGQLARNLSRRFPTVSRIRSRGLLERRLKWWQAETPIPARTLSGAVMVFRADDLRRFRFDERYPLYFEEVDLMRRLRREGREIMYIPGSRVRHAWAQSSAMNPEAGVMFEISRRRFQKRWFGRFGDAALEWTAPRSAPVCDAPLLPGVSLDLPGRSEYLVELGDDRDFVMAAGRFVNEGPVELPRELLRSSPLDQLCCRVIDLETMEPLQKWTVS